MSVYPTQKGKRIGRLRRLRFHVRNFMSSRIRMIRFSIAMWCRVRMRLRRSRKFDPRWKESWWVLEKNYTKLAKRYCKLELRYLNQKDELRRSRDNGNHRT